MTLPARVYDPSASDTRGVARDQPAGNPRDEAHLQRDLATVRALRCAGVEDIALLAAGLGEEPLEAIRAVLREFRALSGLPDLPAPSPPSDYS